MLKLELDWAGDAAPETGIVSNEGDDVLMIVEYDERPGAAGWPIVRVYAARIEGRPMYYESMALDAWLENVYGQEDDIERANLLDAATTV